MLFKKVIPVYARNHMKAIRENAEVLIVNYELHIVTAGL
jgi:hypothetical protein